jgi:hypothetical protein
MLILNFTYPLRCLRVPAGVRVPPVEHHCCNLHDSELLAVRLIELLPRSFMPGV